MQYRIEYTHPSESHLNALPVRDQRRILDTVAQQLTTQPDVPTRNRKRMRINPLASWELRIGHLRVYYDVERKPEPTVFVNAVGMKRGNRVFIGGEEMELS